MYYFLLLIENNLFVKIHNYILFIYACSCCYLLQDFCKRILVYKKEYLKSLLIDFIAYFPYLIIVFYYFLINDLASIKCLKFFVFLCNFFCCGLLFLGLKK